MTERVTCSVCDREVASRVPKGGDGSAVYPVWHKRWIEGPARGTHNGDHEVCPGRHHLVERETHPVVRRIDAMLDEPIVPVGPRALEHLDHDVDELVARFRALVEEALARRRRGTAGQASLFDPEVFPRLGVLVFYADSHEDMRAVLEVAAGAAEHALHTGGTKIDGMAKKPRLRLE